MLPSEVTGALTLASTDQLVAELGRRFDALAVAGMKELNQGKHEVALVALPDPSDPRIDTVLAYADGFWGRIVEDDDEDDDDDGEDWSAPKPAPDEEAEPEGGTP